MISNEIVFTYVACHIGIYIYIILLYTICYSFERIIQGVLMN